MSSIRVVLAVWLVAFPALSDADSLDAELCAEFSSTSGAHKTKLLADFYQAISTAPIAEPPFELECIAAGIARLEPFVTSYCETRAQRGHGLLAGELRRIEFEFMHAALECEDNAAKPFFQRIENPIYCRDIESYLRDSLPLLARISSRSQVDCMSQAIPDVAARLRASCRSEPIPGRVAFGYWDVLSGECPESDEDR